MQRIVCDTINQFVTKAQETKIQIKSTDIRNEKSCLRKIMSIISLAHRTDHKWGQTELVRRTYRVEGGVDVPIGTIGERGLLEVDLDVVGRRGGGTTALRLGGIQQDLQRGNGVQLRRLLVHFAWNIIFVIVIVCGFFFASVSINNAVFVCLLFIVCWYTKHECGGGGVGVWRVAVLSLLLL